MFESTPVEQSNKHVQSHMVMQPHADTAEFSIVVFHVVLRKMNVATFSCRAAPHV